MKLRWPGWPDFLVNAPAKTAGKRAVRYTKICRRYQIPAGGEERLCGVDIVNHNDDAIIITIEKHFTKAGKKLADKAAKKSTTEPPIAMVGVLKRMADK